jgi:hypothetical protein
VGQPVQPGLGRRIMRAEDTAFAGEPVEADVIRDAIGSWELCRSSGSRTFRPPDPKIDPDQLEQHARQPSAVTEPRRPPASRRQVRSGRILALQGWCACATRLGFMSDTHSS